MANEAELAIVLRARDEASKVLKTMDEQVKKSSDFIKEHAKAIGLAFAAAGAAGLKLVDDAKELNAQLGITAKDLGLTTGEMRDLVLETANVTLPVEEAIKSFDLLTRAGIKDAQTVADVTNAFDSLADATGKNTSAVVEELIPAFKAFKIPLEDAGKHVDKFMWLTRNTTVDVGDFARAVEYIAPDMDTLGLSIEDTVAMMAAMEAKGVSGTMVTRELRTAVSQAAKGEVDLMTALGLTKEELDKYSTSIADSTGMTQEYADIANSQFGIVDKLKHGFKELTLQLGSYLEPMEPILAGMTAMGPIMMALSTSAAQKAIKFGLATASMIAHTTATIASTIATKAATAATWLFTTAMTANPIWLVVAALGALATALGVTWLWTNKMTDSTENMTKAMSDLEKQMFLTRMQQQFSSDEWAEVEKRGYLTEKQFSNLAKQLEITTQELYDQMQAAGALEVVMATVGDTNVYLKVKVNQTSIATQELTTAIKEQAEALDAQDSALEQANRRFNELLQTLQY
ncbi:MAG: phage tail tape measure protein, partial [Gammaproteobacteria bacterium]|nr:phage tail tape measure protein [Gammaproteobacteria bacterium]